MEGQLDAEGNVINSQAPAVEDIPAQTLEQLVGPDNEWLGSGPDPRTAAQKKAAADTAAAGAAQGGKAGQAGQARDAANSAGFEIPEGAGGGKGGSGDELAMANEDGVGGVGGGNGTDGQPDVAPPPEEGAPPPGSDVPGQNGNTEADPNAGDFEFDDTGDENANAPEFTVGKPETYPDGPRITGHTAAARARIQEYTDQKFKNYLNEGGNPNDFKVYNPPKGKFKNIPAGPERHAARMRDRDRYYRQQQRAK
jgi:hypothetical protein